MWKAATLAMHPTLDKRIVDEAYESDPEAARAEYGAEFRTDLADFVTREAIDAVTAWGRSELPPEPGIDLQRLLRSVGRGEGRHDPGRSATSAATGSACSTRRSR